MIWVAWRQFHGKAFIAACFLVAFAIVLAFYRSSLVHLYDTTIATCATNNDCDQATQNFNAKAHWNHVFDALMLVAPGLIGIFWGAPLISRELETGTFRLAWTQSVTRARWTVAKLGMGLILSMVVAGLLSLIVTWWSSLYDRLQNAPFGVFDQRDIVPLAYAAFAFAFGVAVGAIIRRMLPAMVTTLVGFILVRYAISAWIRPHLSSPLRFAGAFAGPFGGGPGASGAAGPASGWILSDQVETSAGRVIGQNGGIGPDGGIQFTAPAHGSGKTTFVGVGTCPNTFPADGSGPSRATGGPLGRHAIAITQGTGNAAQRCIASFHLREVITYLPSSRYWPLQWAELGIFLGLTVGLGYLSFWWVRRRLA